MNKELWVVCETAGGGLSAASQELIGEALRLAGRVRCRCCAVFFTGVPSGAAYGQEKNYLLTGASDEPDSMGRLLAQAIREYSPEIVLAASTPADRAMTSIAAALSDTGLTADCTAFDINPSGKLVSIRPALGGGLLGEIICPSALPQMATARPGSFNVPSAHTGDIMPETVEVRYAGAYDGVKLLSSKKTGESRAELTGSRVIVSGGLGVGSREGFALLGELAEKLGGCVGASRAAVNAGYAPYACQVGQSGSTVRPDIYLALGISGAVQHLSGIRGAGRIVAVNSDPSAPIFRMADLGIVADWRDFVKELMAELETRAFHPVKG